MSSLVWRARRLRQMSRAEITGRMGDRLRQAAWGWGESAGAQGVPRGALLEPIAPPPLPEGTGDLVDPLAAAALVAAADRVLSGTWVVLGVERADVCAPDWFLDPISGTRAPDRLRATRIDHRDERVTGNVKQIWELSRHHHLTVLAAAYWLTGEEIYAACAAAGLRSWWAANPPLRGIHWTNGIELGIRLISWTWVRRLLDGWPQAEALYAEGAAQLWWHQRYLAAFPSRGTSANNHAIAEAAGLLVASCALPWFAESSTWSALAARRLSETLRENTFASGLNREQASDYHRFVTELGLVAAVEADAAGTPLPTDVWRLLTASVDAAAAVADVTGRPPRQGDGDEGRGLLLDDPDLGPDDGASWAQLLSTGAALVGSAAWWQPPVPSVGAVMLAALAPGHRTAVDRPDIRPHTLPDAGLTVLRTPRAGVSRLASLAPQPAGGTPRAPQPAGGTPPAPQPAGGTMSAPRSTGGTPGAPRSTGGTPRAPQPTGGTMPAPRSTGSAPSAPRPAEDEIWCRCDGGPHGLPGIAAHAHADALAVEVRHDGIDVLADPGTYCYHGEAAWRRYFRSTLAHNTIEVDGADQSVSGGPFLWTWCAESQVDAVGANDPGQTWVGHHTGYERLGVRHDRVVSLDIATARITLVDALVVHDRRRHRVRMAYHLGPAVTATLDGATAQLSWPGRDGRTRRATLHLPGALTWSAHRGETEPILGWYSPRFGERVPATTLLGEGAVGETSHELCTALAFHDAHPTAAVCSGHGTHRTHRTQES